MPEFPSYADGKLDLKLLNYIRRKGGYFIEAGANDGISQSNTLLLEKQLGWKGLLVEPLPDQAARCRINRPGAIVENVALVAADYPSQAIKMTACNLMSTVYGSMGSEENRLEHTRKGCLVQDIAAQDIEVPVSTLSKLLRKHNLPRIDLLSLDVEGYEIQVLQGLDFEAFSPTYMLIEARFKKELDELLAPLYDELAVLSHRNDTLFRRKGGQKWSRLHSFVSRALLKT